MVTTSVKVWNSKWIARKENPLQIEEKNIHRSTKFSCLQVCFIYPYFSFNFFPLWFSRFSVSKPVWPGRTQQGNFCLLFLLSPPSVLHSMGSWSNYLFTGELMKNVAWSWIKSYISFCINLEKHWLCSLIQNKSFLKHLRKTIITIVVKKNTNISPSQQHNNFHWIWVTCLVFAYMGFFLTLAHAFMKKHGILRCNSLFFLFFLYKLITVIETFAKIYLQT